MLYVEHVSLMRLNKFPVILREFGVECAEIWCLCAIDRAKFAVDSLLIPENGYSGIGFWVIKYRPTRKSNPSHLRRVKFSGWPVRI